MSPGGNRCVAVAVLTGLIASAVASGQSVYGARSLEQAGLVDAAWAEYRAVLENDARDLDAYEGFVRLGLQLEQADTVLAVSARLRRAVPESPEYEFGYVAGLLATRRRVEALAVARRAAEKWPARRKSLAEVLERGGELGEATRYLRQLADRSHDPLEYGPMLVELYERQNQPIAAAREVAAIVNARPAKLGEYLPKLALYAVRADVRHLLSELGSIADAAVRARAQAEVLVTAGRASEAVKGLRQVLGQQGLYALGREWESTGRRDAALAVYRELAIFADQARVLRELGRTDEARAALVRDSGPGATLELAELQREQRDFHGAVASYERVLARRPYDEPALFGSAAAQLGLGRLTEARMAVARARTTSDRLLLLLARLHFFAGEFDSLRAVVADLTRRFPRSPLVNDGLELTALALVGEDATRLARVMLAYEIGDDVNGRRDAKELANGSGLAAEYAWLLQARFDRRDGRPDIALARLDSLAARFPRGELPAKAKFEQALILRDDLRDEKRYRRALEELVVRYPASAYAPVARGFLSEQAAPVLPGSMR